jgi:hypothetical protein
MRASKLKPRPPVRVRHDPPTLEEAVFAAQGITSDLRQQSEIAAGFMNLPVDEVRAYVMRAAAQVTAPSGRLGVERPVVVERKNRVRKMMQPLPQSREPGARKPVSS